MKILDIFYTSRIKNNTEDILKKETKKLSKIEYLFFKKRYYRAWNQIKSLT